MVHTELLEQREQLDQFLPDIVVATGDPKLDGFGGDKISDPDMETANERAKTTTEDYGMTVGTPSGDILDYDPKTKKPPELLEKMGRST